jgi:hypothetical protein
VDKREEYFHKVVSIFKFEEPNDIPDGKEDEADGSMIPDDVWRRITTKGKEMVSGHKETYYMVDFKRQEYRKFAIKPTYLVGSELSDSLQWQHDTGIFKPSEITPSVSVSEFNVIQIPYLLGDDGTTNIDEDTIDELDCNLTDA